MAALTIRFKNVPQDSEAPERAVIAQRLREIADTIEGGYCFGGFDICDTRGPEVVGIERAFEKIGSVARR